jgi:hypothetical protein
MIELTNVAGVWHCTDDWEQDMAMAIGAGDVGATELAADAVTTAKILNLNVTAGKLAADSVTTAKIENLAVTVGKLAGSITFAKLAVAPKHILTIPHDIGALSDADILTDYIPGFKGKIVKISFLCKKVTTSADGAASVTAHVEETPVTGGVITLGNATMKTKGLVTDGTAITGTNAFTATEKISVVVSSKAGTISDGDGAILLVLEQTD